CCVSRSGCWSAYAFACATSCGGTSRCSRMYRTESRSFIAAGVQPSRAGRSADRGPRPDARPTLAAAASIASHAVPRVRSAPPQGTRVGVTRSPATAGHSIQPALPQRNVPGTRHQPRSHARSDGAGRSADQPPRAVWRAEAVGGNPGCRGAAGPRVKAQPAPVAGAGTGLTQLHAVLLHAEVQASPRSNPGARELTPPWMIAT